MLRRKLIALGAAGLGLSATPLGAQEAQQRRRPAATVSITLTQVALLASGGWGDATLRMNGRTYKYKIRGLGVGGLGVSRLRASGEVYNLARPQDFGGAFLQLRAGAVAGDAQLRGTLILRNDRGVELRLKPQREGVALSLGADGLWFEPE